MPATLPDPLPETVISPEVVAAIGAHAASATPGVTRLEAGVTRLLADLGRSARHRVSGISMAPVTGTSATVSGGRARVSVQVAVSGERPAAETAAAVQSSVARAVTAGTGLPVESVSVAILDIGLPGQASLPGPGRDDPVPPPAGDAPAEAPGAPGGGAGASAAGAGDAAAEPGSPRARACAEVVRAVRSVPGLRPAGPARPDRARWVPWDPAILAVSLDDSRLEVQLAATRLPLPPLLERAAGAIREATAETRWASVPGRLVVTALDASALTGQPPGDSGGAGRDESGHGVSV